MQFSYIKHYRYILYNQLSLKNKTNKHSTLFSTNMHTYIIYDLTGNCLLLAINTANHTLFAEHFPFSNYFFLTIKMYLKAKH